MCDVLEDSQYAKLLALNIQGVFERNFESFPPAHAVPNLSDHWHLSSQAVSSMNIYCIIYVMHQLHQLSIITIMLHSVFRAYYRAHSFSVESSN